MNGPLYELQAWAVTQSNADAGIKAIFGDPPRIYEDVPLGAVFPYASLGEDQGIGAYADGLDLPRISLALHVWSRDGRSSALAGLNALDVALNRSQDAPFSIGNYSAVSFVTDNRLVMRDPDGITTHGVITFRADLAAPAFAKE